MDIIQFKDTELNRGKSRRELLAVDGTRIKAVNAKDKNFTKTGLTKAIKEADDRLDAYLKQMDECDSTDKACHSGDHGSDGGGDVADKIVKLKAKQDRHKTLLKHMRETAGLKCQPEFAVLAWHALGAP